MIKTLVDERLPEFPDRLKSRVMDTILTYITTIEEENAQLRELVKDHLPK